MQVDRLRPVFEATAHHAAIIKAETGHYGSWGYGLCAQIVAINGFSFIFG